MDFCMDDYDDFDALQDSSMPLLDDPRLNNHTTFVRDPDMATYMNQRQGSVLYHVPSIENLDFRSSKYGDPEFLHSLCTSYSLSYGKENWSYEARRMAQQILPYLYLGPASAARDAEFVRSANITMAVAVRHLAAVSIQPKLMDPSRLKALAGCQAVTFDFDSAPNFFSNLETTMQAISSHLRHLLTAQQPLITNARILVFCETGNDRSPLLIAAFIMIVYGLSATTALEVIQSHRWSAAPTLEIQKLLLSLADILTAQRESAVAQYQDSMSCVSNPYQPSSSARKRGMSDVNKGDDSESSGMRQRPGVAPFKSFY